MGLLGEDGMVALPCPHPSVPAYSTPCLSLEGAPTLGLLVVNFMLIFTEACF